MAQEPHQYPGEPGPGFEAEPMETETPRRAASAQFAVEPQAGAEAELREAMDPANQSLAGALRLSYRVLQGVIVVLIGLFLVSGFQRVDQNQSGVMLRFGSIVKVDGQEALEPGWRRNFLPDPIGQFIIFNVDGRPVDLGDAYWPKIPANVTLDRAIESADVGTVLKPGEVGSVLTADGDLGHLRLAAQYEITDPVRFVKAVKVETGHESDADRLVRMALGRAVVHAAAEAPLADLVDQPEVIAARIGQAAQEVLDSVGCGIRLTEVRLPDVKPPLAIYRDYREVHNKREEARQGIEKARQDAQNSLNKAAGPQWRALVRLVGQYEEADNLGQQQRANEILAQINAFLESDQAGGDLAGMISHAQATESEIELTLGSVAQKFAQSLPAYRAQPELECRRLWVEAVKSVMSRKDIEIFRVPAGLGRINIEISRSEEVQKILRDEQLKRREQAARMKAAGAAAPYYLRPEDWETDKSNPLLRNRGGKVVPVGSEP